MIESYIVLLISSALGAPHIALFDFSPQDYRELPLKKDEVVNVVQTDAKWANVVNKAGQKGWVPQNFIVKFDQVADTKATVDVRLT